MTTMNRADQGRNACRMAATVIRITWLPIALLPGLAGVAAQCHAAQPESGVTIAVDCERVIQTMRGGFGASWHAIEEPIPVVGGRSHGGSAWGGHPPADDDQAWEQIYRHADWLGLDFIRVEVEQRMYQPERERFTWDSPEMRILYRILDWCQQRGADVFFQQMWSNVEWNAFPEFRDDAVQRLHSGPQSTEDFARGLAALVQHLVRTKRYTCIKWIAITNEPGYDWSWWQQPPNKPLPLRPGLEAVRRALDAQGMGIPLSGPDMTDLPAIQPQQIDYDPFVGAYDLHSYYARFDWHQAGGYPMAEAETRLRGWRQWATDHQKPLFLSEVGSMIYGWGGSHPGPASFEAAIKDAELVVRALNLGVEGFNRWSFVNRGDLDGHWQMIETWDRDQQCLLTEFPPKPNAYFVYGLICRLTAKHSHVLACDTQGGQEEGQRRVFATALKTPGGQLTWIIVNDAPRAWPVRGELRGGGGKILHKYQVTAADRDQAGLQVRPLEQLDLANLRGTFETTLPPMSLTIYSTLARQAAEAGVIQE